MQLECSEEKNVSSLIFIRNLYRVFKIQKSWQKFEKQGKNIPSLILDLIA